jgi:hypothetical protein
VKFTGGSPKLTEAPIEEVRSIEVPSEALESHLIQDKHVLGVEVVVNVSDNIKQVTEQLVLQVVFPESGMS